MLVTGAVAVVVAAAWWVCVTLLWVVGGGDGSGDNSRDTLSPLRDYKKVTWRLF